jgi:hypothetical protein
MCDSVIFSGLQTYNSATLWPSAASPWCSQPARASGLRPVQVWCELTHWWPRGGPSMVVRYPLKITLMCENECVSCSFTHYSSSLSHSLYPLFLPLYYPQLPPNAIFRYLCTSISQVTLEVFRVATRLPRLKHLVLRGPAYLHPHNLAVLAVRIYTGRG